MAELLSALQNVFTLLFVVTSMLAMGLSLTIPQILGPLKHVRLVVMALVANFVVVPATAVLLARVIPVANILFASEMIGAVRGIDPESGHPYDDTRRYVDAAQLDAEARRQIYEGNARRVYPRLDAALKARGRNGPPTLAPLAAPQGAHQSLGTALRD